MFTSLRNDASNLNDILFEFRMMCDDSRNDALSWWFAIADYIAYELESPESIPVEWKWQSPMGIPVECYEYDFIVETLDFYPNSVRLAMALHAGRVFTLLLTHFYTEED